MESNSAPGADEFSDTRLRKLDDPEGPFTAIIVATAGLNRINLSHRITKSLPASEFPYAIGQGALGIEIRADDESSMGMIRSIEDLSTRWICLAERSLLRTLQGGCSSPVAVNSVVESLSSEGLSLRLEGIIIHPYGSSQVSSTAVSTITSDANAEMLGKTLATQLENSGGKELLNEIRALQSGEIKSD